MGQTTVQSQSHIHQPHPPPSTPTQSSGGGSGGGGGNGDGGDRYYKASAKEATVVVVLVVVGGGGGGGGVHTFCSFLHSQVTHKYTRQLSSTLGKKPGTDTRYYKKKCFNFFDVVVVLGLFVLFVCCWFLFCFLFVCYSSICVLLLVMLLGGGCWGWGGVEEWSEGGRFVLFRL